MPSDKTIGLDVGLKNFYTSSDGDVVQAPKPLKKYLNKVKKLHRKLSKKQSGSNNKDKARIRLTKTMEKISNIRNDFLHKLSTQLIRENQTIAVEKLNIEGMKKNHKLARSIDDVSWGQFFYLLQYKSNLYGRRVVQIDPYFPSSQLCSHCGYKNKKVKNLSVRNWICPRCGANHDRDKNAAINILKQAMANA